MFKHYLKIALRNFVKDKGYSVINLAGLALALACSFLFVLWVQYENNLSVSTRTAKRKRWITSREYFSSSRKTTRLNIFSWKTNTGTCIKKSSGWDISFYIFRSSVSLSPVWAYSVWLRS